MFEQTKALCQHFLKMGIPCFDLIVYKDGECILRYMGGYADPENKIPMSGKEKIMSIPFFLDMSKCLISVHC